MTFVHIMQKGQLPKFLILIDFKNHGEICTYVLLMQGGCGSVLHGTTTNYEGGGSPGGSGGMLSQVNVEIKEPETPFSDNVFRAAKCPMSQLSTIELPYPTG